MDANAVIEDLEAKARHHETTAQKFREAATTVREAYGLTARQQLTAPVTSERPRASAPAAPPTPPVVSRPELEMDADTRRELVVTTLQAHGPMCVAVMAKRPEFTGAGAVNLANDMQVLKKKGRVKSTLTGWAIAGTATSTPAPATKTVLPKSAPPLPAARTAMDARAGTKAPTMADQVADALMAGPFATIEKRLTAAELMPYVKTIPQVGIDHILSALGHLVRHQKITLLSVGTERVYRRVQ